MIKISASIVTYNSSDVIVGLLDKLKDCKIDEIYVIDNNSSDNTVDLISENYSWVKLIKSTKNLGYGGGHNLAIKAVDSDIHLIINPDIILEKNQIEKIENLFQMHRNIVLACPKVLNVDGTEQFLPKRNPKIKYLLGGFFNIKKYRDEYTMKNQLADHMIDIEFCTGCFMICRTEALKKCGGFDDRYFLYFEDADLSRKMLSLGDVVYAPQITVTHMWKRENKRSIKGIKIFMSSYFKYKKKWKKK